ncbi:reverse transcriptase domain-containing protein [Bacillus inaquosorum]|uniref:reverse transcriptase domain-containing protein n=1 Tax=Bacillus inaquosorum TaxID=483913 RepID=UPI00030EE287|nr:reverse transcriptase domain-containing protein [Bacillus inaquosorum]MCY8725160.1 reverse transcriptase domain-containing protein [Bacillus inaquosorum]MEC0639100.1 reverse transcriptase domain-containing protein [Bacillus inaquosorum]MED4649746.1 reverse transcriptase domain-containing protein [Bacillus inaquosorum]MED4792685.1 reverse transcriptase domain-containing protein [Bacillus inaquosorum]
MNKDYKIKYVEINGKLRKVVTYNNEAKRLEHIEIKRFLERNLIFSKFTKAYIPRSSIYNNARAHMYNDIFIKYDIEKFFNHINHKILVEILYEQLNLKSEKEIYSMLEVSELIGRCILGNKGLPFGLITSPILANIYLKEFDNIFYGKLKKMELNNIIYTRYADDLTISFKNPNNYGLVEFNEKLTVIENVITKLLKKYRLRLNSNKKSIINLKVSNHVRITGISITKISNDKRRLSVGKKKINRLFDDALQLYLKKQRTDYTLTDEDFYNIRRVKGMESFILSVHKTGYSHFFSEMMLEKLKKIGFNSLHDLIKTLD